MRLEELFNKKVEKVMRTHPITEEEMEIEKYTWSYECLEFTFDKDDLIKLSKVELTDEEFNFIVEGFNFILNNNECKDLLDEEEIEMITYALNNLQEEQSRIYLLVENIGILYDLFYDNIIYELSEDKVEKSLLKKLMEALTDE